jgi:hypothetical protein
MRVSFIKITGFFCFFTMQKSHAESISWINANQAATAAVEWDLEGDYYIVDVFVNGTSPFTCVNMITYDTALGLGEGGQCDIRSNKLDGLIEVHVKSFSSKDDSKPAETIVITRKKDTLPPKIYFNDGQIEISDLNLDENSIRCSLNGVIIKGCELKYPIQGNLNIKASDFAGNQTIFTNTK